jgi:hypothetical protein
VANGTNNRPNQLCGVAKITGKNLRVVPVEENSQQGANANGGE